MKKFKLMAIALLSSAVALSSCMLLPKKKGSSSSTEPTSGTSTPGGSGSNSGSQTPTPTDWSDEVKANMKKALDNEVLPFFSGTWEWNIDEEGTLTGASEDATLSNVKSKLSGWEIKSTSYMGLVDYDVALKLHTNSGVYLQIFEGEEAGVEMYGYYTPEKTAWSETEKSTMVSLFGEEFPFPGGQWSDIQVDTDEQDQPTGEYWIETSRSYNEAAIDQVLRSKGYESAVIPATEEYDEYTLYEKTSSKGYIQAYLEPSLFTNSGYVTFYLSNTSVLVDETFKLASDKAKYLKGDSGTLTLTVGADVPAGEVAYTVAPEGSATVTKTETGATFVISNELTQDTEITFTATQGEFTATCKIMAYYENIPTETLVYKLDCTVAEGGNAAPYNSYGQASEMTRGGIDWSVMANTYQTPWRFGGKSLDGVDRDAYTKTVMAKTITKVEVTLKDIFTGATLNYVKVTVSKNADFSSPIEEIQKTSAAGNETLSFEATKDWTNCYFKISVNVSVSGDSNKCVQVTAIDFWGY